jgi:hypothetical protein
MTLKKLDDEHKTVRSKSNLPYNLIFHRKFEVIENRQEKGQEKIKNSQIKIKGQ